MENQLYEYALSLPKGKDLSEAQRNKLMDACKQTIKDNEGLDFGSLKVAIKIYLNFIKSFPDLGLPE